MMNPTNTTKSFPRLERGIWCVVGYDHNQAAKPSEALI
jgi:hypothetical protein